VSKARKKAVRMMRTAFFVFGFFIFGLIGA
jgi:hypothetical protein